MSETQVDLAETALRQELELASIIPFINGSNERVKARSGFGAAEYTEAAGEERD